MKVGIITMHCPLNYGAVLQTYALQTYIESLGHQVEIVDYRPEYILIPKRLSYIGDKKYRRNIFLRIAYLALKFIPRIRATRNFGKFLREYINLSAHRYMSLADLEANAPDYDMYVCGSDQIWNVCLPNGNDDAYFLSFAGDKPKISYAASMSRDGNLDEAAQARFASLLKDFCAISVREDVAVNQLAFLHREIVHVLDPVFLLPKESWIRNLRLKNVESNDKYILIYPMGDGRSVFRQAKRLSEMTGLPIYSISQSNKIPSFITKNYNGPKVTEFVSLINNATYVISNSFHGTAFSFIMQKNFWACSIKNTGSRIGSLLRTVGLESRMLHDDDTTSELTEHIDYKNIENNLSKNILHSEHFIINSLTSCQRK